jgi:hypothetical protein
LSEMTFLNRRKKSNFERQLHNRLLTIKFY